MFANCPVRPLLAEACRGVVSTTPSGIFAFTFSATAMIEGSLSQRSLQLPTNKFSTKSANRTCKAVRLDQFHFPGHVVVGPAMIFRPSVGVQSLLSQVHGATSVLTCPTLGLETLAVVFACPQLIKNCPSTQLITHEGELSPNLVWSGLSLTVILRVTHPPWCSIKREFFTTSNVTPRTPFDILQPIGLPRTCSLP